MRILIAEEALETGTGHWPHYIGGLAQGFRESGDEVDVLMHREAPDAIARQVGGTRWFSRNCWLDVRSQGRVGGLRHSLTFYREMKHWLKRQKESYDWILCLTMRVQHLPAVAFLSRGYGRTRFLLLFVQGFGRYRGHNKPIDFPTSSTNRLARLCFSGLGQGVRRGQCLLAAETEGMRQELEQFTGLPAYLFPHPVPLSALTPAQLPSAKEEIVLTAPGFARHEKGSDLLREAIEQLFTEDDLPPVRFILQWAEPFTLPDGSLMGPGKILEEDSRVELVNESLGVKDYLALLQRSDLILLPYRRSSYHNRLSRVAIEAAGIGKPLVYMSGTWSAEVAEIAGTGVAIEEESEDSLRKAILQALEQLDELRIAACQGREKVASFHTANHFRQKLIGSSTA